MNEQIWSAAAYDKNLRYVSDYGMEIFKWLDPQKGEVILDIGCGDGVLTAEIEKVGACVTGLDSSENLLEKARHNITHTRLHDAQKLDYTNQFDAVFSNAALHWMQDAKAVIDGVYAALKSKGRFVVEFGGHGNIAAIMTALRGVADKYTGDISKADMFFFPTEQEYTNMLEQAGFTVEKSQIYLRQTPIKVGMKKIIMELMSSFFTHFPEKIRDSVVDEVVALLKPSLCDIQGNWIADYVRLRVRAVANK